MHFHRALALVGLMLGVTNATAQWEIQDAHTTASLRGIHYVGNGVAWASGTEGTVLRTEDMGFVWQLCTIPPGAEHLDFRGIQAFDNNTAIVMSSGKGDLSRLYKTTDGCQTWRLVATNPDGEGFWDSAKFYDDSGTISGKGPDRLLILGDSVGGKPKIWDWRSSDGDSQLEPVYGVSGNVEVGEGSFAASNSVMEIAITPQIDKTWKWNFRWASETPGHAFLSFMRTEEGTCEPCRVEANRVEVPLSTGTPGSGIFSFHFRTELQGVAVGGDYGKPGSRTKTAAYSADGGLTWKLAKLSPYGYRSAVAYDMKARAWIAVGPNGTDISTDDGRNWHPLKPGPGDAADADKNWNALSLPFVVGPKGRIGLLHTERLTPPKAR